jgi:hypothetical protein
LRYPPCPDSRQEADINAPDLGALFKPLVARQLLTLNVMDRNIRCDVQEHQNNQWMKIIDVSHFGFL